MGSGRWNTDSYVGTRSLISGAAASAGVDYKDVAFAYSRKAQQDRTLEVHPSLNPKRINSKPFGKLESRDSEEHPTSNAVLVCFDVTGSNYERAVVAQQKLTKLMDLLGKYLADPQVSIAANDDFYVEPERCVQFSDYESDNRVDDHLRNTILVNDGGGNMGESYDLVLYGAAYKTILDCVEKRNKKGYLFMYADEPFMRYVSKDQVKAVYGDKIQSDIKIEDVIAKARELYEVYIIWPKGGYIEARDQYEKLFGKEYVLTLQNPDLLCELVGSIIGINEEQIKDAAGLEAELTSIGADKASVKEIIKTVGRKFRLPAEEASA